MALVMIDGIVAVRVAEDGDCVSKAQLKRRLRRQRQREKKQAEKKAAKPAEISVHSEPDQICIGNHCSCKGAFKIARKVPSPEYYDKRCGCYEEPRKYRKWGRDDRHKDRRLRQNGSGLVRI